LDSKLLAEKNVNKLKSLKDLPEFCKGMKQDMQLKAMKDLKTHKINTLIATCIAEEGLDFGEIDLIVCYDASGLTPVRMMQRFGRTGRKRAGRVIMFLNEYEIKKYE
jgi:ERCC4-related helicase